MKRTALKRKVSLKSKTGLKSVGSSLSTGTKRQKTGKTIKKQNISTLKKKLWEVFSKYIRERDKGICFTCGRYSEGSNYHAGHFVPKSVGGMALYFHEDNVHGQCYSCNINLGGNQYEYGKKLGKKAEELIALKQKVEKWSVQDYLDKIEHYKSLCLS